MKRILLILAALAGCLAATLFLVESRTTPVLASGPEPTLPAFAEPAANAVKLSYVELEASPHRTEQPGATQVYGWVTRGDNGQPVRGGRIRLFVEDYSLAEASAAESHATAQRSFSIRWIEVQDDGGWFIDLPGKCWVQGAEFMPRAEGEHSFAEYFAGDPARRMNDVTVPPAHQRGFAFELYQGSTYKGEAHVEYVLGDLARGTTNVSIVPAAQRGARSRLIRTYATIERALERDALEVAFTASPGIQTHGIVFDARSADPIPGAKVALQLSATNQVVAGTGPDGGFELYGLDPDELHTSNGMLTFLVSAPGHEDAVREIAWERGQPSIPAFKVVLAARSP